MSSKYGVNATKRLVNVPSDKISANAQDGIVRVAYDTYELVADLAASDKIYMGHLPGNCRVLNAVLAFDDLDASGGTLDFGYEYDDGTTGDVDGFGAAVDVTSAGIYATAEGVLVDSVGLSLSNPSNIIVTVNGDTDATSGTITAIVYYVVD
jgi:hypothetical protein